MEIHDKALYDIFAKHAGIMKVKTKMPVRDNYALSLVYTPGVGACCKEIEKDQEKTLRYTNKGNQIFLMTDCSGFAEYKDKDWHYCMSVPYLECLSIYYKTQVNLDAFPIILDDKLVKNADDIIDTIQKVHHAFSGIELYRVAEATLKEIEAKWDGLKDKPEIVLFTQLEREYIKSKMESLKFKREVNSDIVVSCLFRAAIDCRAYGIIKNELIDLVLTELKKKEDELLSLDFYFMAYLMVSTAAKFFVEKNMCKDKAMTAKQIESKFQSFLQEGGEAWFDKFPPGYISSTKNIFENSNLLHERFKGVIEIHPKIQIKDPRTLDKLFSEAQIKVIVEEIRKNPEIAWDITCKRNYTVIVTDGTAVLGYGNITPLGGLPVMEGKSALFKELGGTDMVPICINVHDPPVMIDVIKKILPIFSAINLEDIKAPECFETERTLIAEYDFPVFHDDQHGTAIVTCAAMINSLKILKKQPGDVKVVVNGAGAGAISVVELLMHFGVSNIILCDTKGAIYKGRTENMNKYKVDIAERTNFEGVKGTLAEVLKGRDFFIGLSAAGTVTKEMVQSMAPNPVIFALANPIPEIYPAEAYEAGALICATGRSDFPNQVNNSLAFPGLFRGALDIRAKQITKSMKVAAAKGIASLVDDKLLSKDYIIPNALDPRVPVAVARSVAEEGIAAGLNKRDTTPDIVADNIKNFLVERQLKDVSKQ